jgi:ligand-binding sensor domain-containing protein/serine phosphatase RsbU (regulator of sigma subunit)
VLSRPYFIYSYWFTLLSFLTFSSAYAQQGLKYELLGLQHGLSQSSANAIVQDNLGFIWVATQDGLNRYNGYEFKVFRHSRKDSFSILDNHVRTLFVDDENLIWAGTDKAGLASFDSKTQKFTNYPNNRDSKNAVSHGQINAIIGDKKGNIWIGTAYGLNVFDKKNKKFTHFFSEKNKPKSLLSNSINSLEIDQQGRIWVGTPNGVNIYDPLKKSFDSLHFVSDGLKSVSDIFKDKFNVMWLGMADGRVLKYDEATQQAIEMPNLKFTSGVAKILEDEKNNLWFVLSAGEIIRYNVSKNTIEIFNPDVQNNIAGGQFLSGFIDKSGVIWFGSESEGILKYDNQQEKFKTYAINPAVASSKSNVVWIVYKDREKNIWAGTEDGVFVLPKDKTQFDRILPERLDLRRNSGFATFFQFENDDDIAISLNSRGFWKIPKKGKDLLGVYDTLSMNQTTFDIIKDKKGFYWAAASNCIARMQYQPETKNYKYKYFFRKGKRFARQNTIAIHEDSEGNFWLATTDSGLVKATRNANDELESFEYFPSVESDPSTLSNNFIFHSALDPDGKTIWVATANGLNKFDTKTKKAIRLGEKYEQANFPVYGILIDEQGMLWMSSNVGILKFDPKKEQFINFTIQDGLQSNEFNQYSFYKAPDGEMFFGGIKGFNSFYPKDIKPNPFKPNVVITDFKIFNQHIYPSEDSPLTTDISLTDYIELTHEQYIFSFDFVALSFRLSEKNQYAFIMEGFEKEWNYVGNRRFANYSNLPAGDYIFKVKAANNDGVWNDKPTSIKIRIKPPFWKTWLFIISSSLLFLGSIYGFYRQRIKIINAQKIKLQQLVTQRTAEVVEKNASLEKQKSELEKSYDNVRIISEIGQKITAILDVDKIIDTVYKNVNMLMDASAFGIGILSDDRTRIEFRGFIEDGHKLPDDFDLIDNNDCLSVWCYKNKKEILINDFDNEHIRYVDNAIKIYMGKKPESVIYVPLLLENEVVGVLTVQSFNKNTYEVNNITLLRTLASYISIAIDNANAYTRLDHAKEQLANKTTALLDSIRYGETIQKAILPNAQRFYAYFTDYFVIYKPKDVVSGDFYWAVEEKNGNLFLAVVDCTGHGVPGAFMSMIGNTLLSDIVSQKNIHEPEDILEDLHNAVRIALHQEDKQNSDGMDLCLARIERIDEFRVKVVYAGAKRPLFFIKDGYLFEEKGSKKSIGGRQKELDRKYHQTEILLKKGDLIYLTTDGYVDQNNPDRLKFGTLRFKNLLRDIHSFSMNRQEEVFLSEMEKHQNKAEQRDDIAIIGIRL